MTMITAEMNKNKLIIFDLDRVLFDTDALINFAGDSEANGPFTPAHARKLDWQKAPNLLYSGTKEFLKKIDGHGWQKILFSEGNIEGQRLKLKLTGLDRFFEKKRQFIFENKVLEMKKVLTKIKRRFAYRWYIDDKPSMLNEAKKIDPSLKVVLMKRDPWWRKKITGFKADFSADNLQDFYSLICSQEKT